jgi:hypothetical protein
MTTTASGAILGLGEGTGESDANRVTLQCLSWTAASFRRAVGPP